AMGSVSLISMLLRPHHMLIIATFPLSALAVLVNHFAPATGQPMAGLSEGLLVHISTSLLAFGVLTLGTFQGILVSIQTQRLRNHKTRGIIRMLPPLDTMEQMFYELLLAGTALLTVAILTGGVFIDDLLGQKLVHKTVLTSLGWALMTVTLLVQWRRGWRIGTALTLVFVGYALLALGFFGSKLVLELIL
ncbi:MAG: cytochrome c biogenesis protein CcsA, partial [Halieaceae bacterium]